MGMRKEKEIPLGLRIYLERKNRKIEEKKAKRRRERIDTIRNYKE